MQKYVVRTVRGDGTKPLREIAVDLYGREPVDADWRAGSWMRARVRRLVQHARDEAPGDGTGPRPAGRR